MNHFLEPAIFDSTPKMVGTIQQTGEQHIAVIDIAGVQFRSWLPKSEVECRRINFVASMIIAKAHVELPVPTLILD